MSIEAVRADVEVAYVSVSGQPTRVLRAGDDTKPSLYLIHGVGLSADMWLPVMELLGGEYRIVAPDLLWHGFTTGPRCDNAANPHEAVLDHLIQVAQIEPLDRLVVVGSSYGGLLALNWHLREPRRHAAVVVVGSGSAFDENVAVLEMLGQSQGNAMAAMRAGTLSAWQARFRRICHDHREIDERVILSMATAYSHHNAQLVFEAFMNARRAGNNEAAFSVRDRLGDVSTPVLIMCGDSDIRASGAGAQRAAALLSDVALVEFADCGHLPPLEIPAVFAMELNRFLRGPLLRQTEDIR